MAVLSVQTKVKKIPTYVEHDRTKRTNEVRPNLIPTDVKHGRIKHTNVRTPKNKCYLFENMAVFSVSITFSRLKKANLRHEYGRINKTCTVSTLEARSFQIPCSSCFNTVLQYVAAAA